MSFGLVLDEEVKLPTRDSRFTSVENTNQKSDPYQLMQLVSTHHFVEQ